MVIGTSITTAVVVVAVTVVRSSVAAVYCFVGVATVGYVVRRFQQSFASVFDWNRLDFIVRSACSHCVVRYHAENQS